MTSTDNRKRLSGIRARCEIPSATGYKYYGGRGIKCLLTLDDVEYLWKRDRAFSMAEASIDRINPDGHYTRENCRFIEMHDNRARQRKPPTRIKKDPMKTFELRLIPPDLHAAIKAAAFREGVSMNKWILKAVRNEVERSKDDEEHDYTKTIKSRM